MSVTNTTPFSVLYDDFLTKITDDMYMEMDELDTYRLLHELLITAIHKFEFPRVNLNDYEDEYIEDEGTYSGAESNYDEVKLFFYMRRPL